jgi:hypothetical protein
VLGLWSLITQRDGADADSLEMIIWYADGCVLLSENGYKHQYVDLWSPIQILPKVTDEKWILEDQSETKTKEAE